jgi:hypothetical protein
MSPNLKPENGHNSLHQSHRNEEKVLIALNRFGWLPVSQVHAYCWPNDVTGRSPRRVLANLLEQKQVTFKTRSKSRDKVYTLTKAGAVRLQYDCGIDAAVVADFAKSVVGNSFAHRCLANDIVTWWGREQAELGGTFYTEQEIISGRAPFRTAPLTMTHARGKIPDGIMVMPSRDPNRPTDIWYGWVEVELGWKNRDDQKRMVAAICDVLALHQTRWEIGTRGIVKFALVACPKAIHEARLTGELRSFLSKHGKDYNVPYIKKWLFIWRPDGTRLSVGELMAKEDATLAIATLEAKQEASERARAEVRAIAQMHARLRAESQV